MEIIHRITVLFGESPFSKESLKIGAETLDGCAEILTRPNRTEFSTAQEFVNAKSVLGQIPESIVEALHYTYIIISALVALNIIEAVLYFKIFNSIKA